MAETWLAGAGRRYPGNDAGSMNRDGSRKLGLHSTEGGTIAGAVAAYTANNSWPHITADCPRRVFEQHLPLEAAARSFRNDPGGADQTNRDGDVTVQIELVGYAGRPESIGDRDDLEWLGQVVVGPACRAMGIPLTCGVVFLAYPDSYGDSPVRLSPAAWDAYSGVLGHQHVPDNDHGDPGAIDVHRILAAARGPLGGLTMSDVQTILRELAEIKRELGEKAERGQVGDRFGGVIRRVEMFRQSQHAANLVVLGVAKAVLDAVTDDHGDLMDRLELHRGHEADRHRRLAEAIDVLAELVSAPEPPLEDPDGDEGDTTAPVDAEPAPA